MMSPTIHHSCIIFSPFFSFFAFYLSFQSHSGQELQPRDSSWFSILYQVCVFVPLSTGDFHLPLSCNIHSCKCLCVCVFAFVSLFVCIVLFVYVPLYLLNCVCVPLFTGDFHLVRSRNIQSWRGQRVHYASTGFTISNLNVYN